MMMLPVQSSQFQVVVFVAAVLFFDQVVGKEDSVHSIYSKRAENTRADGSNTVVVPYPVICVFKCAAECSRDESCNAFAYNQCEKLCHKYGINDSLSETLVTANGWAYYKQDFIPAGEDCADLYKKGIKQSGVYNITPTDGLGKMTVYCDMWTDGGGWTVFQKRQDGSVEFYRGWSDYKNGFGNLQTEFWLGNENIHRLTQQTLYNLRVDLENCDGVKRYACYGKFAIASEAQKYELTIYNYSGDVGDSLIYHNGRKFTTKDSDNDMYSTKNCAVKSVGAWWYGRCHHSNLNGRYNKIMGRETSNSWKGFKCRWDSLKKTSMKIRPATFNPKP